MYYFILISILGLNFSNNPDSLKSSKSLKPSRMIVLCQSSLDTLEIVNYEYINGKVSSETTIKHGKLSSLKVFDYNSDDLISLETYFADRLKIEKTFVYNSKGQLINILYNITNYKLNGKINDIRKEEAPREYKYNLLVKEWAYWGGFKTYEYVKGKIVARLDYDITGNIHHITTFAYVDDLLIEEIKETKAGDLMYIKDYEYDSYNRLIAIWEGEKIVEENYYDGIRLIEKREYYYGMDPYYSPCAGNCIYLYEY